MKRRNRILGTLLAGSLAAFTLSGFATASPARGFGHGCDRAGGMHANTMMQGGAGLHRLLARLDLTEAQRDQVFSIVYKQIPAMRAKKIALRKGRQALHKAALDENYDARHIRTLADAQAKTQSQQMVMRAELFHQVAAVLTPAQRKQLTQIQAARSAHRPRPAR